MDNFTFVKEMLSVKVKDASKITPEISMKELGIDSLDLVDLMLDAESKLNITFADDELLEIKTVADAVKLLDKKLGK